jgi:transposase-like protein
MSSIEKKCPKCHSEDFVKSGIIKDRQRFKCKQCSYYFTVQKLGKRIEGEYVVKALQLYLEGMSFREIERILNVSHVSVMNWVKTYNIKRPNKTTNIQPEVQILPYKSLMELISDQENLDQGGILVTPVEDNYLVLTWKSNYSKKNSTL